MHYHFSEPTLAPVKTYNPAYDNINSSQSGRKTDGFMAHLTI